MKCRTLGGELQGMLNPGVLECWSTPQLHLDVAVRGREKPDDTVRKRFTAYRHPIAQLEDGMLRYESSGGRGAPPRPIPLLPPATTATFSIKFNPILFLMVHPVRRA